MRVPGWGSPSHTSGRKHVQLLNYVIEITFITSIPQSQQFLSTQNKSSVSQSSFRLCFPWVLGPTLVLPVFFFFLPDITDTSPTAEENKEEAWPARKDTTLDPSQIKNMPSLSAIQHMFTKHQLCAMPWSILQLPPKTPPPKTPSRVLHLLSEEGKGLHICKVPENGKQ